MLIVETLSRRYRDTMAKNPTLAALVSFLQTQRERSPNFQKDVKTHTLGTSE